MWGLRVESLRRIIYGLLMFSASVLIFGCAQMPDPNQRTDSKPAAVDWRFINNPLGASCRRGGTQFVVSGMSIKKDRDGDALGCEVGKWDGKSLHFIREQAVVVNAASRDMMCPDNMVMEAAAYSYHVGDRYNCVELAQEWTKMRVPLTSVSIEVRPDADFMCPAGQYMKGFATEYGGRVFHCGRPEPGESFRPAAPTGFRKLSSTPSTITFGWNPAEAGSRYRVTRDHPYPGVNLGETDATSITVNAPAGFYWYSIKSIVGWKESEKSPSIIAKP